ncbi:MAG: queuosine precursor transporter [Actinomycetaceae bacterium]|nr:queuosine precursor transporter [Actinomycetaceae bacterium]
MDSSSNSAQHCPRLYDIVAVTFVSLLLLSNVTATKLIELDVGLTHLIFDGGAILFPVTYVIGDVLAEVYGFARARRVILLGFVFSIGASLIFWIVGLLPPASDYANQEAFVAVLGFVPRIVVASVFGYLAGQLLNSWVLVAIKRKWGRRHLWARLIGSTLVGEFADTLLFCSIAFYGVITGGEFFNYLVVGYVYKVLVEVILLPVTYPTIAWVKKIEANHVR